MKTAKALGFAKGDFVFTGAFPGIIISDAHTATPCCEVWGFEQEMGSCYAYDLRKLSYPEFVQAVKDQGYDKIEPYSKVSKTVIACAEEIKEVKNG